MRALLFLLLLVPQLASAKVYMCVDEITGQKSFTDKGCQSKASREEVKVLPANANSGSREAGSPSTRESAWISDRDTRKTGRDYSAERRRVAEISPEQGNGVDVASGGI
jgi:hypothetical protein